MIDGLAEAGQALGSAACYLRSAAPTISSIRPAPSRPGRSAASGLRASSKKSTCVTKIYGPRRVHAELTLGMGVKAWEPVVAVPNSQAKIVELPGPRG
jgi:hypothetical protein